MDELYSIVCGTLGRILSRKLFTKVLSKTALRVGFVFILSYTSRPY
jgi:energy-converting hydrogenase Eha subunit C